MAEEVDVRAQVGLFNWMLGGCRACCIRSSQDGIMCKSRAVRIALVALGILLIISGVILTFVLQSQIGTAAFVFLVPQVLGLLKLLIDSIYFEESCSPEKWRVFQKLLGKVEDIIDDGVINESNKIFS